MAQDRHSDDEKREQHPLESEEEALFDLESQEHRVDAFPSVTFAVPVQYANSEYTQLEKSSNNGQAVSHPNQPHPALECPLFYLLLKRFPWLNEQSAKLYESRWRASYPLQNKLPQSKVLQKWHIHLTYGEALILIPFWVAIISGLLYTFVVPSVSTTGQIARAALIACFAFAQRNSIITLLIGMPVDRTLFHHKLSGRIAFLATLGHAYAFYIDPRFQFGNDTCQKKLMSSFNNQINTSGTIMMMMVFGIILTSLPIVRRRVFRFFYFAHLVCVWGVVLGALFHTGILVPLMVVSIWGVDLFLRSIVMARHRYPRQACLSVVSETVVQVSFPKIEGFDYNPGQYVYIAIPGISWLEWHPFSISSSPHMDSVTLHIRKAGNWTHALYQLAAKGTTSTDILIEGPYGSVAVDLMSDRYKVAMLVSGGIGITPMQSILNQLLAEEEQGSRSMKRIKFIWSDRDPLLMENTSASLHVAAELPLVATNDSRKQTPSDAFEQVMNQLQVKYAGDDNGLDQYIEEQNGVMDRDEAEPESIQEDDENGTAVLPNPDTAADFGPCPPSDLLDMQLYFTGKEAMGETQQNVRCGRPDLKAIFLECKAEAQVLGEKRVAVCVCAPTKIIAICRKACIVYSDREVCFDFHSESME